ncbi:MAG: hypothetical protein CMO74_04245 [Verrucomicrobiales bacterium]|nr:hypothetical protein [Verrucomicrobiales bacterium]
MFLINTGTVCAVKNARFHLAGHSPGDAGTCRVAEFWPMALIGAAVLFIGLSKAGLGGGLGMLTTPVCVVAFGAMGERPQFAIGFLLPLLIVGDTVSLYHYWRQWRLKSLKYLLPGVAVGAWVGVQFIDHLQPHHFSFLIGLLAVGFVGWQFVGGGLKEDTPSWQPSHLAGIPCGIGAGLTSTFAHGAGPVVNIFLLPQRLPKADYIATRVILFCAINWIKLPLFVQKDLVTLRSLKWGAAFCLLVPVGAWLGVRLQRRIPEQQFRLFIYILTLLAGIHLIISSLLTGKSSEKHADSFEHPRIVACACPWKLSPAHAKHSAQVRQGQIWRKASRLRPPSRARPMAGRGPHRAGNRPRRPVPVRRCRDAQIARVTRSGPPPVRG